MMREAGSIEQLWPLDLHVACSSDRDTGNKGVENCLVASLVSRPLPPREKALYYSSLILIRLTCPNPLYLGVGGAWVRTRLL